MPLPRLRSIIHAGTCQPSSDIHSIYGHDQKPYGSYHMMMPLSKAADGSRELQVLWGSAKGCMTEAFCSAHSGSTGVAIADDSHLRLSSTMGHDGKSLKAKPNLSQQLPCLEGREISTPQNNQRCSSGPCCRSIYCFGSMPTLHARRAIKHCERVQHPSNGFMAEH